MSVFVTDPGRAQRDFLLFYGVTFAGGWWKTPKGAKPNLCGVESLGEDKDTSLEQEKSLVKATALDFCSHPASAPTQVAPSDLTPPCKRGCFCLQHFLFLQNFWKYFGIWRGVGQLKGDFSLCFASLGSLTSQISILYSLKNGIVYSTPSSFTQFSFNLKGFQWTIQF